MCRRVSTITWMPDEFRRPADTPATVTDDPLTLADGTIIPMKRVTVTYSYTYMFVGAVGGWFGGSFSSRQLTAVAKMRTE